MKKKNPVTFWFCLAAVIVFAACLVRHFHIRNFNVIKDEILYTSGQPRGMDYTRLLYKYHIATFINLRCPEEHREENWHNEEAMWMRENGANYIELPVAKRGPLDGLPDESTCRKFIDIMSNTANLPVVVHDDAGRKRAAYLAAVWMLKSGGFSLEETVAKLKKIKDEPLEEMEINFLKSYARQQLNQKSSQNLL